MPENADIDLKKRARRRLVGAIALVLLAALILPSLMDSEPAIPAGELNISIPDMPAPPEEPLATASAPVAAAAPQSAESAGAITPPADAAAQQAPQQEEEAMPLPASVSASEAPAPAPAPAKETPSGVQTAPLAPAATPEPSAPAAPVKEETPKAEKPAAQKAKPAASKTDAGKAERERAEAALEGRKPAAAPKADSSASGKRYLVQVAAVSNAEKAKGIVATLRKNGFNAYTEKAGELTRIRVSGYNSREAAEQAAEKIRNLKSDVKFSPTVQSQ